MTSSHGPTKQALLEVAKQAVADCCSIAPGDVHIDDNGYITVDSGEESSSALLLSVDMEPNPCFLFQAQLLTGIEASTQLYRIINEVNLDLSAGQVYFEDGCISYYYKLPTQEPSSQLIAWLIRTITVQIDEHDDALKEALGGQRWADDDDDPDTSEKQTCQSFEDLMLRDLDETSNNCNSIMMQTIADYVTDEEMAEYADADDEDRKFILTMLHRALHCELDEFREYFRGYYGTPDNNFHGVLTDEGFLSMSQDEFFDQLNWQEIFELCRRHCTPELVSERFHKLAGANYSEERKKFPIDPWDGSPQWEMVDGQYVTSE